MPNLHFITDLHLEFGPKRRHTAPPGTDIVVIGGDTHPGVLGLMWAAEMFAGLPIVYVPGNHEYYGRRALDRHLAKMRAKAATLGIHLLDRDAVVLHGVRILGATLWTDYALYGAHDQAPAMVRARGVMNDYRRICLTRNVPLRPADLLVEHHKTVHWLQAALAEPWDGPTVVATHHAPSEQSLSPARCGDGVSPCYASRLEHLMLAHPCNLWLHGHTHDAADYEIGNTRVLSNPCGYMEYHPGRGYRPQNEEYDPALLVTVEGRVAPPVSPWEVTDEDIAQQLPLVEEIMVRHDGALRRLADM